jgi:hypothetical protein
MSRMLRALQVLNRVIEKIESYFAIVLMGGSALITIAQVVTRYGFNHPLTWPEELCTLLPSGDIFRSSLLSRRTAHEIDFFTKLRPSGAAGPGFLTVSCSAGRQPGRPCCSSFSRTTPSPGHPKNFFAAQRSAVWQCAYILLPSAARNRVRSP